MAREPVPARDVAAVLRNFRPAGAIGGIHLRPSERCLAPVAARFELEERESRPAVGVTLDHERIHPAIVGSCLVRTAALIGGEQATASGIVGEHHQTRATGQRDHSGGLRVEIHLRGSEPRDERCCGDAERGDQAREISVRERHPMPPAAVATPIASKPEMLRPIERLLGNRCRSKKGKRAPHDEARRRLSSVDEADNREAGRRRESVGFGPDVPPNKNAPRLPGSLLSPSALDRPATYRDSG